jgi:signal transduction histidine kinase
MKIQTKIALLFSLLTASFIALLSLLAYYFASQHAFQDFYRRLDIRAIIAAKAAFEEGESDTRAYEEIRLKHLEKLPTEEEYFLRVDDEGLVVPNPKYTLPLPENFYREVIQDRYGTFRHGNRFYTGILYTGHVGRYVVIVSATNEYSEAYTHNLRNIFFVGTSVSVLVAFTVGMLFSKQVLAPIRRITTKVQNISSTNLHLRLDTQDGTDEIAQLASTFNNMLDRLETSFESQKNFISNASHELGTPLTAIIGEAEYALRKSRDDEAYRHSIKVMLDEANRLKHITVSLLSLAQTGFDGKKLNWERIRIDELLFAVFSTIHNIHAESQIHIDHKLFPEDESLLTIEGNQQLLHMAFGNIILNACKYSDNRPVSVAVGASDREVIVSVADQGIGIPENELKYIYDPFFRASNTRNYKGYGIGLPLSRNIIRLHQGQLTVSAQEGKGTQVQIRLPIASEYIPQPTM